MEGLTQEEKAKAYDKAYKLAESICRFSSNPAEIKRMEQLFPELAESEDEKIREHLIKHFKNKSKEDWNGVPVKSVLAWLEKQGEKNPADKPESTFKVGDILVSDEEDRRHIYKVDAITNYDTYLLLDLEDGRTRNESVYTSDLAMHLWSIEDAKDGDVLAFDDETIVIFKDLYNATTFHSYCCYIEEGTFSNGQDDMPEWWEGKGFHPATKEQRETLERAMADAGYTFDFEKKELKKFCELDNSYTCVKFPFKAKVKSSDTIVTIHGGQLSHDGKEWIKYQSDAEDGYKIYDPNNLELVCEIEQTPAWGEDEEDAIGQAIVALEDMFDEEHPRNGYAGYKLSFIDAAERLKSLKGKCAWKPSDEQLDALHDAAVYVDKSMFPYPKGTLMKLYKQLKKLREG